MADIADLDPHAIVTGGRGAHREATILRVVVRHRVAGVHHEIEEHLLELHTIAANRRELRRECGLRRSRRDW